MTSGVDALRPIEQVFGCVVLPMRRFSVEALISLVTTIKGKKLSVPGRGYELKIGQTYRRGFFVESVENSKFMIFPPSVSPNE